MKKDRENKRPPERHDSWALLSVEELCRQIDWVVAASPAAPGLTKRCVKIVREGGPALLAALKKPNPAQARKALVEIKMQRDALNVCIEHLEAACDILG